MTQVRPRHPSPPRPRTRGPAQASPRPLSEPALPHERDERPDPAPVPPDPRIEQAARDLADGQVDTDLRATPGLDAVRRRKLVPGSK